MTISRASLIIPTYNQPRSLGLVLTALKRQSVKDFEVVVADDGSTIETAETIAAFQKASPPFPVRHFWQPDEGFRVGEARNGAIRMARGDWLIFLDGDMLPHPRFVEAHLKLARPNRVLFGGRIKLTQAFSAGLDPRVIEREGVEVTFQREFSTCREKAYSPASDGLTDTASGRLIQWYGGTYRPWAGGVLNASASVLPRRAFFKLCFKSGSNFSTGRGLMERVNGFDCRFNDLSGEDGELFWRLIHAGAEPRSVLFTAIAYHLWHPDNWERTGEKRGRALAMEQETRRLARSRCADGLVKDPAT